jgi:PIN domain nuclease of toxin-antitoxin system
MGILLDTCVLYWLAFDRAKLSHASVATINAHLDALFVSSISAFEVAMNHRKGRVVVPMVPARWFRTVLRKHHIQSKPVTSKIALLSVDLPPHHNDPFDRIIIATAAVNKWPIVTPDREIAKYAEITAIW